MVGLSCVVVELTFVYLYLSLCVYVDASLMMVVLPGFVFALSFNAFDFSLSIRTVTELRVCVCVCVCLFAVLGRWGLFCQCEKILQRLLRPCQAFNAIRAPSTDRKEKIPENGFFFTFTVVVVRRDFGPIH